MYSIIEKLSNYLNSLIEIIVIALIAILTILTFTGVIARYVTGTPLTWLYEITVIAFAWTVFLGTSIAFKKREHIMIEFVGNALSKKSKRILLMATAVLLIAFLAIVVKEGFHIVNQTLPQKYQTIDLSTAWFYASFPVSAIISILHLIKEVIDLALNKVDLDAEKEINLSVMG